MAGDMRHRAIMTEGQTALTDPIVAILYQALPPPIIDGLRKDAKPGGYSDGGADIAFALRARGQSVVTPVSDPDPVRPLDWVFPDTPEGIAAAIAAGANTLWANTILFEGHPIEAVLSKVAIIGQLPVATQAYDDKFETNRLLAERGLSVARAFLVGMNAGAGVCALAQVEQALSDKAMTFPLIVKPVRGRGSQGVTLVRDRTALQAAAQALLEGGAFGNLLMVEEYLEGEEVTVTVMPPASPHPDGHVAHAQGAGHWALRPVTRFNQKDGVAPYNGDVPVTENSAAIDADRMADPLVRAMIADCVAAAGIVDGRAPIRIDCRAASDGRFKLFDLNMKPNMTGPGRPGRENQDCLSAISARAEGWGYADLLLAMLAARWTEPDFTG